MIPTRTLNCPRKTLKKIISRSGAFSHATTNGTDDLQDDESLVDPVHMTTVEAQRMRRDRRE